MLRDKVNQTRDSSMMYHPGFQSSEYLNGPCRYSTRVRYMLSGFDLAPFAVDLLFWGWRLCGGVVTEDRKFRTCLVTSSECTKSVSASARDGPHRRVPGLAPSEVTWTRSSRAAADLVSSIHHAYGNLPSGPPSCFDSIAHPRPPSDVRRRVHKELQCIHGILDPACLHRLRGRP